MVELQTRYNKSYALIVGIDKFTAAPTLHTARFGATAISAMLSERYKFDQVITLYDEQATKQNIEDAYSDLRRNLAPDDRLIIYWAGHGVGLEGHVRAEGWLVAYDSDPSVGKRLLRMRDLADPNLTAAKHALLILDTCHSGYAIDYEAARAVEPSTDPQQVLSHFLKRRAYQMLASANPLETATDAGLVDGHTPFTGYLLRALGGEERARSPVTHLLTAASVNLYVQDQVAALRGNWQGPQAGILPGDEGGLLIWELPTATDGLPPRLRRALKSADCDTRYFALSDVETILHDARYHSVLIEMLREMALSDTDQEIRERALDLLLNSK